MAKMPRLTIGRLMLAVAVVAVNVAVGRWLYDWDIELLLTIGPVGAACQFAALRVLMGRGKARPFWLGFLTFGLASMAVFARAIISPESGAHRALLAYTIHADEVLALFPYMPRLRGPSGHPVAIAIVASIVWFLPQLLAGLVGGLLAACLARGRASQDIGQSVPQQ